MQFNKLTVIVFCIGILLLSVCGCNKNSRPSAMAPWDSTVAGADSLTFLVMGDWGKYGGQMQQPVADAMDLTAQKHQVQFIITTGDNFYPSGVSSIYDQHWTSSFENIYNKPGHQVPWYPVLGNHDYGINPGAELQYSSVSNRWRMPARYYTMKKNIGNGNSALFAFTDTSPFVKGYYYGGMSDLTRQDTAAQFSWLQKTLAGSGDTWKIVIGHHPVYSVGSHGNTPELVELFRPLFIQTATDFYICGHDHSLQYIKRQDEPVQYLISGGGSEATSVRPDRSSIFARATPGFMVMTLYASRANFYFYNRSGALLFRQQVIK